METRGGDRVPVGILAHWGLAFRGSKGQDFWSIRSLENMRGNLNHPFLGRVAVIERYQEKSRKENRHIGRSRIGISGILCTSVCSFLHCDVRNPKRDKASGLMRSGHMDQEL
jgi:hypothetical protein